ncbi:MAG TPA: cobyrinate a,c-diamide synthase [Steroidobacteraceae bacterium]|nr:cobyrinate a,c-diamide synthase [Steroidobacteraceae bacterium]
MPQLMISAVHKSSGKTIVSLGLCRALALRGARVQPFKKGPDYIDPMWLTEAAGAPCHNLDFRTSGTAEIRARFARHAQAADVALVEGNKGLHDGQDLSGSDSNAALARLLGLPVVLVVDTQGMARGIAPLILGHQAFAPDVRIAGIILNKVASARHEGRLRAAIEHYTTVPVIGAIGLDPALSITERHLGLIPSCEVREAERIVATVAATVGASLDLDRLSAIAATAAPPPAVRANARAALPPADVRIGIARDAAFGFYYASDIEAFGDAGAELVPFDTLRDPQLPEVDGVFIGGGFPEIHLDALRDNGPLRRALRTAIEAGLPVYAECGGLMYLSRAIRWHGRRVEMVGAIPADVVMNDRPAGHGYVRLRETGKGPWPNERTPFDAHEFHYSTLTDIDPALEFAYDVLRGTGIDGHRDGVVYRNVLASYAHLHDSEVNRWPRRFVDFVRRRARGAPMHVAAGA